MGFKAGLVGLPNVGKSTLFNAITKSDVEAANYPFATINPNVGIVKVDDERLEFLSKTFSTEKTIAADFMFVDIAGLVKGASKGEGLGNQFLANIREVNLIVQVVRGFEDKNVLHVNESIDPIRDIETINFELIYSDIDQIDKRLGKIEKKAINTKDEDGLREVAILKKAKKLFDDGTLLNNSLDEDELKAISHLNLLTAKKFVYVLNLNEDEFKNFETNKYYKLVSDYAKKTKAGFFVISSKIEAELSKLDRESRDEMFEMLEIKKMQLEKLAAYCYELLNLKTFFTAGKKEVRAWTFIDGMPADECAGVIHTDFTKKFIKAEIYSYDQIKEHKSEAAIKANGLMRMEGRTYKMKDGDICFFRVGG